KGAQHQDERQTNDSRDRHDIANEIVIEFVVKCRVDRVVRVDQEQRIAVGRGLHDHFGPNIPTGARSIVDDERLAQSLVQPLADQSSEDIVRAARRKGNDQAPRTRWIGLCPRPARYCRNRGSARGQMQKFTAGKLLTPSSSGAQCILQRGGIVRRLHPNCLQKLGFRPFTCRSVQAHESRSCALSVWETVISSSYSSWAFFFFPFCSYERPLLRLELRCS